MFTSVLWRDACAMGKALHKSLAQRGNNALTPEDSLAIAQAIQPRFRGGAPMGPGPLASQESTPSQGLTPPPRHATLSVRSKNDNRLSRGLSLGTGPKRGVLRRPTELWISEEGLLQQVALYGCTGSGRSGNLMSMAFQATEDSGVVALDQQAPRAVFYMDGHGDPNLYFKALAKLSEQQRAGSLRAINLMVPKDLAQRQTEAGAKVSHRLDLFDGFSEAMLVQWLMALAPNPTQATGTFVSQQEAATLRVVARLAMSEAQQRSERLLPEALGRIMTEEGLKAAGSALTGPTGHLARLFHLQVWGGAGEGEIAAFLSTMHSRLSLLWKDYGHVFNTQAPEVGLTQLFQPQKSPLFLAVMLPGLERTPDAFRMVSQAIVTSLRLTLEARAPMEHCDTLVVINEFRLALEDHDIAALSRLRNRGAGVVWTSDGPLEGWQRSKEKPLHYFWPGGSDLEPGTQIAMHQCDGHCSQSYGNQMERQRPGIRFPSSQELNELREGEAFVFDGHQGWTTKLHYITAKKRMEVSFLVHAPRLATTPYALSDVALVDRALERQAQVLADRHAQWTADNAGPPPLAWAQETVARMLGFATWHEARRVLKPGEARQTNEQP